MKRFGHAFCGVWETIKTEQSFRIQLCFAFYVIFAGLVCRLSGGEWAAVLICIGLVLGLEVLNTAIERLCDVVSLNFHPGIKLVKDAAAGAVLIAAFFSAAVGAVIFFAPEKLDLARNFFEKPGRIAAAILALIPLGFFVRGGRRKKS